MNSVFDEDIVKSTSLTLLIYQFCALFDEKRKSCSESRRIHHVCTLCKSPDNMKL